MEQNRVAPAVDKSITKLLVTTCDENQVSPLKLKCFLS